VNRLSLRIASLASALLVSAQFSVVAHAREVAPTLTTEQVRACFEHHGYLADAPIYWESSGLTTFFVQDPERVVLVLVYPDTARAEEEHRLAHALEEADLSTPIAFSDDLGPELIPGYGRSSWWHNVALVQATRVPSFAPTDTSNVQADPIRTRATRRAELKTLQSVDVDLVLVLRGVSSSDT
jgi:hypothetical protein